MRRRRYDHDRLSESEVHEEWSRYHLTEGRRISLAVSTRIDDLPHRRRGWWIHGVGFLSYRLLQERTPIAYSLEFEGIDNITLCNP